MTRTELLKAFEEKGYKRHVRSTINNIPVVGSERNDEFWFIELSLMAKYALDQGVWILPDPASNEDISVFVGILDDEDLPEEKKFRRIEEWDEKEQLCLPVYFKSYPEMLENALTEIIKRELI